MKCPHCKHVYPVSAARCPRCGEDNPERSGLYHSSTVLISSGKADLLYRSVDEVPSRLRTLLVESTSGRNSATILIADRRGRDEIARALKKLPGSTQRRLTRSLLAEEEPELPTESWLVRHRNKALAALLTLIALLLVAIGYVFR